MEIFLQTSTWFTLLTLTFLEVVLGIDNIIFISLVTGKLPEERQKLARNLGLILAFFLRVGLLFLITLLSNLNNPLFKIGPYGSGEFAIPEIPVTVRSIILFVGGLFLVAKSTSEIFQKLEKKPHQKETKKKKVSFASVIIQIILLDAIFSLDSILTAVGLARHIEVMIAAVALSVIIMMLFSGAVSRIINKFPSLQILALAFLILIGFMLILESIGKDIPKGYIYFAIFFALIVEAVNIRLRKRNQDNS